MFVVSYERKEKKNQNFVTIFIKCVVILFSLQKFTEREKISMPAF